MLKSKYNFMSNFEHNISLNEVVILKILVTLFSIKPNSILTYKRKIDL